MAYLWYFATIQNEIGFSIEKRNNIKNRFFINFATISKNVSETS